MQDIDEIIVRHLIPERNFIYGFANLTGLLDKKFKDFNWGISIGRKLDNSIVNAITDGPTKEYYSHYKQINEELAILTRKISDDLNENNIETLEIVPTVSTAELDTIYCKSLRTDFSHKMVATRAGLGWIGKTDLFISKELGPRLRLVSILLKRPVRSKTKPINRSHCGNCNICVENCPAKAANGKLWDITIGREEFFDPWKCRDQCAEYGRSKLGMNATICGICVSMCPIGHKS